VGHHVARFIDCLIRNEPNTMFVLDSFVINAAVVFPTVASSKVGASAVFGEGVG